MLYKHCLSIFGLCNFLRSSLSLFIDKISKPDVIQGSLLIYVLFNLVILAGHDISKKYLYINVKLLYASFGSIANNRVVYYALANRCIHFKMAPG